MLRNQLASIRAEVGYGPTATFLDYLIEHLVGQAGTGQVAVDVFCSAAARAELAAVFASTPDLPFRPRFIDDRANVRFRRLFDSAPLAAWIAPAGSIQDSGVFSPLSIDRHSLSGLYQKIWYYSLRDGQPLSDPSLDVSIEKVVGVNDFAQLAEHLSGSVLEEGAAYQAKHHERVNQSAIATLKTIFLDESKALAQRKSVLSSRLEKVRGPAASSGSNDLGNQMKNLIQKNLHDVDRVFRLKYEELSRPNIGKIGEFVASEAEKLTDEHIERIEIAAKFETFETLIADTFTTSMCGKLRRRFEAEAGKDLAYLGGLIDEVRAGLKAILGRNGYMPEVVDRVVIPDLDPSRLGNAHFMLGKRYKGEVTKPGVIEYFQALRDYTGMIMVVVGIVAPLTLVATAPGAESGSLLAKIDEFAKEMKNARAIVTFITAALVAFMVVYGVFDLRRRIPLKRRQEQEKEVRLAREFLTEQGLRMFSEAQRDWVGMLGQSVRDFTTMLNSELEVLLRSAHSSTSERMLQLREELERERASLDHKLRNFSQVERMIESLGRGIGEADDAVGPRARASARNA